MKNKVTLLSCLIVIMISASSYQTLKAQSGYANTKDMEDIKSRKLIVCIEQGDEKTIAKFADKPGQLKEYQDKLAYFNQSLKNAVDKIWKLSAGIEYKNYTEVAEIISKKDKTYAILMFNKVNVDRGLAAMISSGGGFAANRYDPLIGTKGNRWEDIFAVTDRNLDMGTLLLKMPEKPAAVPSVFVNLASRDPLEEDFYYGIYQLQKYCNVLLTKTKKEYWKESSKINGEKLKGKTLYILSPYLNKQVSQGKAVDTYKNKVEFVDAATYREVIMNNKPDAAYVMIAPEADNLRYTLTFKDTETNKEHVVWMQYVVDAADGEILAYSDWGISFNLIAVEDYNAKIKESNLKDYMKKR